jgi:predicted secreted hydrolase
MGLQLTDGTDLMIYRLRNSSGGTDYLSGTRVTSDGKPHYLSDREIAIEGGDGWRGPTSGGVYPQRWTLRIAGLPPMVVRSLMPGQELVTSDSTDVTYFEGASEVLDEKGQHVGDGYLEMTGYSKSINGSR